MPWGKWAPKSPELLALVAWSRTQPAPSFRPQWLHGLRRCWLPLKLAVHRLVVCAGWPDWERGRRAAQSLALQLLA